MPPSANNTAKPLDSCISSVEHRPAQPESSAFTFIDLFAGIGGFHLALDSLGGKCVFASEIDEGARSTYKHNFEGLDPSLFSDGMFNSDIRAISPDEIPDFDVLCAGFPCQPFSQAGHKRGFDDTHKSERGNLFFNIADILKAKRPKAFFLENVRGLLKHDNGNTFKVIRDVLERELGYSVYWKVVKASDYGLPQLRPRVFIVGFRDEGFMKGFNFPPPVDLRFTMSDVWEGECSRDVGFTLRVGGRGSGIDDRRNWDSYLVDGKAALLGEKQAKIMQGFPSWFTFPVSPTQAMKQLGNSVAIDAVRHVGEAILAHMSALKPNGNALGRARNKGEWTEIYSFFKLLHTRSLPMSDRHLKNIADKEPFSVTKVTTKNIAHECLLMRDDEVVVTEKESETSVVVPTSSFINEKSIGALRDLIKSGSGTTFPIPEFDAMQSALGISIIKGGTSSQKADIVLDITQGDFAGSHEGFGIKSFLGSKPTLLNASNNTNFVMEVKGLAPSALEEVNSLKGPKNRLERIHKLGGFLVPSRSETETMDYNLRMEDTILPELIPLMLVEFFHNRNASVKKNLTELVKSGSLDHLGDLDLLSYSVKIKRFLVAVLLGMFPGTRWDGKLLANGTIVVRDDGEQLCFHITDMETLQDYLFQEIRFDTPSTTRHRYGALILESDGKLYFKLNMQLRF